MRIRFSHRAGSGDPRPTWGDLRSGDRAGSGDPRPTQGDLTFALAVTATLLVSPICWEHYLLLLLAPLAIVWIDLPATWFARVAFSLIVVAFCLGYPVTWTAFDLNGRTATPVDSLGILSYQFYALLGSPPWL